MLDLSLCEYRFPVSPNVVAAVGDANTSVNLYPRYKELYKVLEEYTSYSRDHILIGNGSNEIISWLSQDLLHNLDKVVIVSPDFPMYDVQARRNRCRVERVNCFDSGFKVDADEMIDLCQDANFLWLSNPNNPTGGVVPEEALNKIINGVRCTVCVDECYYSYYGKTVLPLVAEHENLIVLRSLSKTYGLAGLRFGFAVGDPKLLKRTKSYFRYEVNSIAVAAAIAAINDEDYYRKIWKKVSFEREFLRARMLSMGCKVLPTYANFVCAKVGDGEGTRKKLEENGVFVKVAYELPEWIRIGVGTHEMNKEFLKVFRDTFKERRELGL